ncbi:MAG: adenosine deaminase family protein [Elusimicrobiota bacterium]|jgi:adenosine deaminase|nr:adenosine deaminase family protein [Elusimicrobiota bacterium]
MPSFPKEFLLKMPKADLHVHLDGSLRLATLIELAKQDGIKLPAYTQDGLRKKVFKEKYKNLVEYLQGFYYTNKVLQTAKNLERVSYELAEDNIAEGVRHIEVRFAPQLHVGKITVEEAFRAVNKGLKTAQDKHNKNVAEGDIPFNYGIIAIAHRNIDKNMSAYYRDILKVFSNSSEKEVSVLAAMELARTTVKLVREEMLPIVGFDVAGQEDGYPAENYKDAFQLVHENFIRKTVHAGEAYGPESIFQAITDCHANRIGHGTFLFAKDMLKDKSVKDTKRYIEELASYIAEERIGVEVCLTSNLQTNPAIKTIKEHPVKEMVQKGIPVSICTDNRLVSNTTLTREFELLCNNFNLSKKTLRNIVMAGFKGAFFWGPYNNKRDFIGQVIAKYNRLESEYLK